MSPLHRAWLVFDYVTSKLDQEILKKTNRVFSSEVQKGFQEKFPSLANEGNELYQFLQKHNLSDGDEITKVLREILQRFELDNVFVVNFKKK